MINLVQAPCDEGVISARLATAPCEPRSARWILAATILGSSMAFIDGTVVNVALPALQKSLGATVPDVQWVIESYSLFLAALLLVGGSLGDHYGRRRIFLAGVAVFAVASLCCGLVTSVSQLIVARAIQGIGAALLVPGSLAIIGAVFSEQERGRAIGTWAAFTAITTAIGPVIGGWLIENFSWRGIFFINVPLAIAVWLISLRHIPSNSGERGKGGLDWLGAALVTIGLGSLVFGLIESLQLGFRNHFVFAAFVAAVLFLGAFLKFEMWIENPMLPLVLFRSRNFSGANLLTLFLYGALGGTLFFLPLNLIQVQGYSATAAGAALLPFILTMFLLSRASGGLIRRFGAKIPLVIGPIVAAVGFLLFARPEFSVSYWRDYFPAVFVLGLGMTLSIAPLTTTVMSAVVPERMGIASGINNAIARAGGLLAIAVFGIIMLAVFDTSLHWRLSSLQLPQSIQKSLKEQHVRLAAAEPPPETPPQLRRLIVRAIHESFIDGFRTVTFVGGGLALAGGILALLLIDGEKPPQNEPPKGNV